MIDLLTTPNYSIVRPRLFTVVCIAHTGVRGRRCRRTHVKMSNTRHASASRPATPAARNMRSASLPHSATYSRVGDACKRGWRPPFALPLPRALNQQPPLMQPHGPGICISYGRTRRPELAAYAPEGVARRQGPYNCTSSIQFPICYRIRRHMRRRGEQSYAPTSGPITAAAVIRTIRMW